MSGFTGSGSRSFDLADTHCAARAVPQRGWRGATGGPWDPRIREPMEGGKPTTSVPMRSRCDITQRRRMGMENPQLQRAKGGKQPADILGLCPVAQVSLGAFLTLHDTTPRIPSSPLLTASRLLPQPGGQDTSNPSLRRTNWPNKPNHQLPVCLLTPTAIVQPTSRHEDDVEVKVSAFACFETELCIPPHLLVVVSGRRKFGTVRKGAARPKPRHPLAPMTQVARTSGVCLLRFGLLQCPG